MESERAPLQKAQKLLIQSVTPSKIVVVPLPISNSVLAHEDHLPEK
jgi:hypothetical protein